MQTGERRGLSEGNDVPMAERGIPATPGEPRMALRKVTTGQWHPRVPPTSVVRGEADETRGKADIGTRMSEAGTNPDVPRTWS